MPCRTHHGTRNLSPPLPPRPPPPRNTAHRYVKKGAASICGFFEVVNTKYDPDAVAADEVVPEDRLMPRTEALPLYTVAEFNEKVGQ